ncbi:hypothetical protein Q757_09670 [Oenococcus alcoholitolerans]|uniref:Uncharacterized protein n=1 Tax=Oenococcus alcoholitolerans TaxID=931074 RepID=A0ABR4XNR6_9LACO|nr:hypothetical protein Q757_09670 [Oenococcus alcoholitolerans]
MLDQLFYFFLLEALDYGSDRTIFGLVLLVVRTGCNDVDPLS